MKNRNANFFGGVCDWLVKAGALSLIILTPLAFGSVHPWAFSLIEEVVAFLGILFSLRLLFDPTTARLPFSSLRLLSLPFALFPFLIIAQLIPLPPSWLQTLSPSTYQLYAKSLVGWPATAPYADLDRLAPGVVETEERVVLPTDREVSEGASIPVLEREPETSSGAVGGATQSAGNIIAKSGSGSAKESTARTVSVAPNLTRTELLKVISYGIFFLIMFSYPFRHGAERSPEKNFVRGVLLAVIASGMLVATIGIVERFTWNGKILWFFVPYDWGAARPNDYPHACGPFINYDHFANYLMVIFPLTVAGIFFPRAFASHRAARSFQIVSALGAFVLVVGILLSLSRSGWIGAALGVAILVWSLGSMPAEKRPAWLRMSGLKLAGAAGAAFAALVICALLFVGSPGQEQVGARLGETVVSETSLSTRLAIWRDSLQIPADFPLLGVGLGAWPEIFPHYQSPPWSTNARPREAHNDYLQLLSEMGALGLLMMLWLVGGMAIRIYRSRTAVSSRLLPAIAALLAGIGVMAFHEFFDFSLKIPANAILFSALLAIAMRAIFLESNDEKPGSRVAVRLFACGTFATCAMLLLGSMGQDKVPYPYNVSPPASTSDARKLISAHPAGSVFHQQLYDLIEKTEPARSMSELEIALWLDPINPYTRDQYARRLLIEHNQQAGYRELALSVENSPAASTHAYLHPRLTALLTERESAAVEQGFTAAVAHDYPGAVEALGQFYGQAGRFEDEGKLFEEAATPERDATTSLRYLLLSGMAYVQAGDSDKGEGLFRRVSSADPTNPLPYQDLALLVFAQRKDLKGAKAAVIEGIEKGAEPYPLWIALAEMAEKIGERNEARAAMHKALEIKSDSYEANFYLAMLYFTDHDFEHAAEFFGKAAAVQPNSAYALFSLGVAEESRYHFYEAEQAYVRAVRLEPDNSSYQKYLDHLRIRQAQNKS